MRLLGNTKNIFVTLATALPLTAALASPPLAAQSPPSAPAQPPIQHHESIDVVTDLNERDVLSPDPAERVYVRQDLLDANPGRPGAPVSIPGYPIETASGGIKAPQYFAPGVAGDHGEPIAQFLAVGTYLVPNNLSANAHGNGYADPNIFIPAVIGTVQVDGGAFNVREGNHSVNLAATYGLRTRLEPFVTLTGDSRDLDLVTGLPVSRRGWLAFEASYGNGFLNLLEHRQQYKLNGRQSWQAGAHRLTLAEIAYYGVSRVPGLVPIRAVNAGDATYPGIGQAGGDTIDPRQRDQTHTALVALNDLWRLPRDQELQLSGFFRTYNLALYSDFGAGLIRQSEFRTVTGTSTNYVKHVGESFSLLAGLDYGREAPRRDNLDHYGSFDPAHPQEYGPFTKVASNDLTLSSVTPYGAAQGRLSRYVRVYAGWRREEIDITNDDRMHAENSFEHRTGLNLPKATVTFVPRDHWLAPRIALSYGEAFYTNDPRIGSGSTQGSPVSTAHAYQLVATKTVLHTDLKLTLGHTTQSATLAKIDADTGLQENEGPGVLRFLTVAARRGFARGFVLATFSKADARDLDSGQPTPEAPRTIFDLLGTINRLPLGIDARGEFEYVGAKPLGTGCAPNPDPNAECVGVPVKELRLAATKPFLAGRLNVGGNFLIAGGYTGQTTESFDPTGANEIVGVRIPSYASLSVTWRFDHHP